jgi:ribosomal protein S12 methylthiotransferase accessory factor
MLRFQDRVLDAPLVVRDGTTRAAAIADTWARFAPRARRAGITRLAELTGLDTIGIPVFAAIRPLARSLSTQQGKGLTREAAKVSALMESLETYSAEHLALPRVRGSARALARSHRLIDVRRLPRPRRRLALDATWTWVRGWDLVADDEVLVPLPAVTLDTTFRSAPAFDVSSNGLASGNVPVEAIVHGLCEVIERDAEAAWRRSGRDRRLVLDTIDDAACQALLARVVDAGARIALWDLASDVGLPVSGCAIVEDPREPAWRALGYYEGFGAHLDPAIAIARAVTEAAQTRLTYIAGGRDDFFPFDYARATDPELLAERWARVTSPCDDPVVFDDLPRLARAARSLGDALVALVERVCAAGAEQIVVVDVTHPELDVPCAKVLVPGRACDVEALG